MDMKIFMDTQPPSAKQSENSQEDVYNMSSTLGFNISTIQVFTYLEYDPALQIKICNMKYRQRMGNVSIHKTTQILLI